MQHAEPKNLMQLVEKFKLKYFPATRYIPRYLSLAAQLNTIQSINRSDKTIPDLSQTVADKILLIEFDIKLQVIISTLV